MQLLNYFQRNSQNLQIPEDYGSTDNLNPAGTETYHYFWSGNKFVQTTDNVQDEYCQVIKVIRSTNSDNMININLLDSLCDIGGHDYSTSTLSRQQQNYSSSHNGSTNIDRNNSNSTDLISNNIYPQIHQLTEAVGLCSTRKMQSNKSPSVQTALRDSSSSLHSGFQAASHHQNTMLDSTTEEELIYTCQCNAGYGYENCTKVEEEPIDGIYAGATYCQTSEEILLDPRSEDHIIFIDHAVYGKPQLFSKDPQNLV